MNYRFLFDEMLFPVSAEKIDISINNNNEEVETITDFINIVKKPKLTTYSFELLLPRQNYHFATYSNGFKTAEYYLDRMESLKRNKEDFNFIIYKDTGQYINQRVTLEDYTITEDASEHGHDVLVKVELKTFVSYGTVKIQADPPIRRKSGAGSTNTPAPPSNNSDQSYVVVKGDTLWGIAKRFYGQATKWPVIYNANKSTIESVAKSRGMSSSSNGHWIFPGTRLTIPAQ